MSKYSMLFVLSLLVVLLVGTPADAAPAVHRELSSRDVGTLWYLGMVEPYEESLRKQELTPLRQLPGDSARGYGVRR